MLAISLHFRKCRTENTAQAILEWSAALNPPNALMSDEGSHLKNETVRLVSRSLKAPHHFTLPYTPWSIGGVDRLGKEVLKLYLAILSQLQMRSKEWPNLLHIVRNALNNFPCPQRRNIAPIKIFTGL